MQDNISGRFRAAHLKHALGRLRVEQVRDLGIVAGIVVLGSEDEDNRAGGRVFPHRQAGWGRQELRVVVVFVQDLEGGEGSVRSTLFNNIFKNRPGSGRGAGNGVHFNISMIYGIYGSCMDR